jgi:hypothetical protein
MKNFVPISILVFIILVAAAKSFGQVTLITDPANGHYCAGTVPLGVKIKIEYFDCVQTDGLSWKEIKKNWAVIFWNEPDSIAGFFKPNASIIHIVKIQIINC